MACTTSGLVCVLKFGRLETSALFTARQHADAIAAAAKSLEHEADFYSKLGVPKVRLATLCSRPVLILPHFSSANLGDPTERDMVEQAIDDMVEKGVYHGDMKPEHVFLETPTKKGLPKTVRFVDLTLAREIKEDEDATALAANMKKKIFPE